MLELRWVDQLESVFDLDNSTILHIVGLGNQMRRDDGVGLFVVSKLRRTTRKLQLGSVRIHTPSLRPELLISKISEKKGNRVLIMDAVEFNAKPGSILLAPINDVKHGFFSTHNIPLKLIPSLFEEGQSNYIFGVQPLDTEIGDKLSDPVNKSAETIISKIVRIIAERSQK